MNARDSRRKTAYNAEISPNLHDLWHTGTKALFWAIIAILGCFLASWLILAWLAG